MTLPSLAFSSSVGSRSGSVTPKSAREGPMPRMTMRLFALPSTMKPVMSTLSPVSTRIRVEILARCDSDLGVAVGVAVALGATVAVGVAVAVALAVAVGVALGVAVAVAVAVGVAVGIAVAVALGVGVGVGPPQGRSHLAAFTISVPHCPL